MAANKTPNGSTRVIGVAILVVVLFVVIVASIAYTKIHDDEFFRNREARLAEQGSRGPSYGEFHMNETNVFLLTAEHESRPFSHFDERTGLAVNMDWDIDSNANDTPFIVHRNGGNSAEKGFDQFIVARNERGRNYEWPKQPQGYRYVQTTFQLPPGYPPTKFIVRRYH